MNKVFNLYINKTRPYIYAVILAYILSTILFLFLPKTGVDFQDSSKNDMVFHKYDGFYSNAVVTTPTTKVEKEEIQTLSKYRLKAIYSTTSNGGWIIIEEKTKKDETKILEQNETLNGYALTKLYKNFVLFEKDSKEYKLELPKEENLDYEVERSRDNQNEKIIVKDNSISVNRNFLNTYVNDMEKIWKDIAIEDVRENNILKGFKVQRVAKNSVFEKLGLKEGDVIKAVNGNTLKSYADAFKVYNDINKLEYLTLEVVRNNEMVELNYEIN